MSTESQVPTTAQTHSAPGAENKTRPWPDMSAYGIHFGVLVLANGDKRLVMVDKDACWGHLAQAMGFSQSRWLGLYVKSSLNLNIPGFKTNFPAAKVVQMTERQLAESISGMVLERRNFRISQMKSGAGRMSWRPKGEAHQSDLKADREEEVAPKPGSAGDIEGSDGPKQLDLTSAADSDANDNTITTEAVLRQTVFLGSNALGQRVYESGDGTRFCRGAEGQEILAKESVGQSPSSVFLRASSSQDLVEVAAGLVHEMGSQRLRSEDFVRYLEAIHGPEADSDKDHVAAFQSAIDIAVSRHLATLQAGSAQQFQAATKLHEARPPFWRPDFDQATPVPLWVAINSVLDESTTGATPARRIDASEGAQSDAIAGFERSDLTAGERHDVLIARLRTGKLPNGMDEIVRSGIRVTTAEHDSVIQALNHRDPLGTSVFVFEAEKSGQLSETDREFIGGLAKQYDIKGLFDLASPMVGAGATRPLRVLSVGQQRTTPAEQIVAKRIPTLYSYDDLWDRRQAFFSQASAITADFEVDGRSDNNWQSPYVPYSQISEPVAMCPRNLLGPIRESLGRLVEKHGQSIDDFVAGKMGWTIVQMEELGFDPEQIDALALCIDTIDDGKAFLEADATGIGKGRVLAATALYARQQGLNVLFVTENTDLFSDFYRDVGHVTGMDVLGSPFVVNTDHVIEDFETKEPIAKAPSHQASMLTYAQGKFPAEGLAVATYTQFNREPESKAGSPAISAWATGIQRLDDGEAVFDVYRDLAWTLGLPSYSSIEFKGTTGIVDAQTALAYHQSQLQDLKSALGARQPIKREVDEIRKHEAAIKLINGNSLELRSHLLMSIDQGATPMQLKQHWIRSEALRGAVVLVDESHNAAGPDSNVGANFRAAINKAKSVVFSSATAIKDDANLGLYQPLFPASVNASNLHSILRRGGEPLREIICAMLAKDGRMIRREHDLSRVDFRQHVDTDRQARNEQWSDAFASVLFDMQQLSNSSLSATRTAMLARLKNANNILNGGAFDSEFDAEADPSAEGDTEANAQEPSPAPIQDNLLDNDAGTAGVTAMPDSSASTQPSSSVPKSKGPTIVNIKQKGYRGASVPVFVPKLAEKGDPVVEAAKAEGITIRTIEVGNTSFSSRLYNISRSFMAALNADQACDRAITALREGRKPVITVENTMETVLQDLIADLQFEKGRVELGRSVGFKDLFIRYVESCLTGRLTIKQGKRIVKSEDLQITDPAVIEIANALRKKIQDLPDIPLSPMDVVIDRLRQAGHSIDEISGRKLRLGTNPDGTHFVERLGKRLKSDLRRAFNSGRLNALLLSLSGSTGISLHASREVLDQSQRELIELQPAKQVDKRLQFWGRVNRRGQVSHPIIDLLSSGIPSEMRLSVMQNASLRRLSANISGNADNQALNKSVPDILNKVGNEVCFRWFESNPVLAARLGYQAGSTDDYREGLSNTKFVDMLTGRMMFLTVAEQTRVYDEISAEFHAFIEECEMNGFNPLESKKLDVRAKTEASLLFQASESEQSAFDGPVHAREISYFREVPAVDCSALWTEIDRAYNAIIDAYGSTPCTELSQRLEKEVNALAPMLLPNNFNTVSDALLSEAANPVSTAFDRLKKMQEWIPCLMPGSIIKYESKSKVDTSDEPADKKDSFGRWSKTGVLVTSLSVPKDNLLAYAQWVVEGVDLASHRRVSLRLSSLFNGYLHSEFPSLGVRNHNDSGWALGKVVDVANAMLSRAELLGCMTDEGRKRQEKENRHWLRGKASDFDVDGLRAIESHIHRTLEKSLSANEAQQYYRVLLTGNLFRAAEASFSFKAGTVCSYSDENGQWNHGILMPESTTLRNVLSMPVPISDPKQALAFIKSVASGRHGYDYLYLTDSLKTDNAKCMLRIRKYENGWGFSVNFLGLKRHERAILMSLPALNDLASGKASKKATRSGEAEPLPIDQIDTVLPALIEGMSKIGAPLMIPGAARSVFNEFLQEQVRSQSTPQVSATLLEADQRDEELADLLDDDNARPSIRLSA
ncbi:MAG: strawberry notch C-terminal domain-containing protein [Polaromonas sp.]|nr:strawberry notch C-terminal domain-containing protein [Polaromonas sp.]